MLFGQILFSLAAFSIAGATIVGLVYGLSKIVWYKARGRDMSPKPEPGSKTWLLEDKSTSVNLARPSLLTERVTRTVRDPVVDLAGAKYRITRLGEARFLVTLLVEGRRLGTFQLEGDGAEQEVVPEADDAESAKLLVRIAVLSSFVRRSAA